MMDIAYILGQNIKKHRKRRGLTQSQLAARLNVTPQNVSKWEKGRSMPDVTNLYLLSHAFGVTADALLKRSADGLGRLMLGIDGGGTKTELCVFTQSGQVLMRRVLGGSNPNSFGMEATLRTLKTGIDLVLADYPDVTALFAGIAGCANRDLADEVLRFLNDNYPDVEAEVGGDVINAVYTTEYYESCTAVITGTGSAVFVASKDGMKRVGGWGYRFDNGFNGYHLGCETLRAVLADEDGVGRSTLLTKLVEEEFGGIVAQSVSALYQKSNDEIASYTRILFQAYDEGDAVARDIVKSSIAVLENMLDAVKRNYPTEAQRTVITGGLAKRSDIMLELMEDREGLIFPDVPPVYGACHYCALRFSSPTSDFYEVFKKDYEELI